MSQKLPETFSPRCFLKARRPERFSDSIIESQGSLDRSLLEYHLDTLTSRSQETDFEHFAHSLAKKEICPNILPQTGPTGGGDSKVDGETYPVSDDLAMIWYTGIGREASNERWAFAFSAKKDWRSKVQSDIRKIASTKRGYTKAFYITNQYVRDKTRAEVEDKLREECGLDVRILDLTWILDRVFSGNHKTLAIEKLHLQKSSQSQVRMGPLDLQKTEELKEIELRIETTTQEQNFGFQFVEDCLEVALIARSLERPRTEIEGLLLRARQVAKKYGTQHQKLLAAYQTAWTIYWWYEEYDQLEVLYREAERHAIGSHSIYDLELMLNLWNILHASIERKVLDEATIDIKSFTANLITELQRIEVDESRPSAALQAKTLSLHIQLVLSMQDDIAPILGEFNDVIIKSEGLVGYPIRPLVEILTELGNVLSDKPVYQNLIETAIRVVSKRDGEITAAKMLLTIGSQQLDGNRPYEAIRSLGRALAGLYKQESREHIIQALYLCGAAYERVGLLWAACGTTLAAASIATEDFWTYEEITTFQAACYNRLKWLELRLGRLPHTLAWHEVDATVSMALIDKGFSQKQLCQGHIEFDAILGIYFLKSDIRLLKDMLTLPETLKKLGFILAPDALVFALGDEDGLTEEFVRGMSKEELASFVRLWRDQPASEDLAKKLKLYDEQTVVLESKILGCQILINCENASPCVELAESILSALESLLSTGMGEHIIAQQSILNLKIRKNEFTEEPFAFEGQEKEGELYYDIRCAEFDTYMITQDMQNCLKDKMLEVIVEILARVFVIDDFEKTLTKLFGDERGIERAINFTGSFVTLGNVLGKTPKLSITDWFDSDANSYSLKRKEEWDAAEKKTEISENCSKKMPTIGSGEPPAELKDMSQIRHDEIETVSLIRKSLWDKAGWSGTAFMGDYEDIEPSILLLGFRDNEAARSIFAAWRKELGEEDKDEKLRIAIIRGISQKNPYSYRVVIGLDPEHAFLNSKAKRIGMISRINTMEPSTSQNFELFLKSFKKHGTYGLSYALMPEGQSQIRPMLNIVILKHKISIFDAWEIGPNDFESVGIKPNDDVILPKDQKDAPVLELFKRMKRGG